MACGGEDAQVEGENQLDNESGEEEEDDEDDDEQTEEDHKNSLKKLIEPNTTKASSNGVAKSKIEIDESLFNLDDLADIQDELEELDI